MNGTGVRKPQVGVFGRVVAAVFSALVVVGLVLVAAVVLGVVWAFVVVGFNGACDRLGC